MRLLPDSALASQRERHQAARKQEERPGLGHDRAVDHEVARPNGGTDHESRILALAQRAQRIGHEEPDALSDDDIEFEIAP